MLMLLGILFVSSIQPMFMVSSLILIVIMYSYMMYKIIGSYWFSYALVMVMLSGVLVVFTYMVSLIPNESFESYNLMYIMGMIIMMMGGFFMILYENKWSMISLSLWNLHVSIFTMFMVSFLLLIMLMVMWFSYLKSGAMRIY